MNEAQTFHCPTCGAPLDAPQGAGTVRCPYCNSTVIVPESISDADQGINAAYAQPVNVLASASSLDLSEIKDLIQQNQKIEAIKRVRYATGLGLKEAKDLVDALERGDDAEAISRMLTALLYPGNVSPGATAGGMLEVMTLAQNGQEIEAIKRYRELTGLGLKESKDAVDAMLAGQPVVSVSTNLEGSSSQPMVVVNGKQATKVAGVAGTSISCGVIALIAIILAATIIPIFFAFVQGGGPLAPFWNQINPASKTDIELRFGEEGIGAGQFSDPRTVAADQDGNIYVGDYSSGRLQSFSPEGEFRWLANLGEDNYIQSLDIDRSGTLLVVARGLLQRFDTANGQELEPFPNPQGYDFEDVSVAPDGRIAAIADSEDIVVFSPSYQPLMTIPEAVSSVSGESELDSDIDIDGLGNLYVLGHFNGSVFKYSPEGRFTNRFASEGEEQGQLDAPGDLAIDGQGCVFISDFNGVQVFDSSGRFLDQFDLSGYVFGLNFDLRDRLYTVSNEPQVMRLRMAK